MVLGSTLAFAALALVAVTNGYAHWRSKGGPRAPGGTCLTKNQFLKDV